MNHRYLSAMISQATATGIALDERERRLCQLLLLAAANCPPCLSPSDDGGRVVVKQQQQPTLRVAGGWVRDKLLQRTSHDMDITLDTMTGYQFASHLSAFISQQPSLVDEISARQGDAIAVDLHPSSVHKVKSNPDKSKHLETATMKLYGIEVDFCNLRKETYAQGQSRVPLVEIGTPVEDAMRRDLTINSLFYNIHTGQIEDFLGTGLRDLRDGIIRTPLAPLETFKDDPLRVLRTIRFASRFNYKIVHEIPIAARDPQIKRLLRTVISKERIGDELKKMLTGPNPAQAISYIKDFGLYDTVFHLPYPDDPEDNQDGQISSVINAPMQRLSHQQLLGSPDSAARLVHLIERFLYSDYSRDHAARRDLLIRRSQDLLNSSKIILYTAAAMIPYHNCFVIKQKATGKKSPSHTVPAALFIAKNGLKFPTADSESISRLLGAVDEIMAFALRRTPEFAEINLTNINRMDEPTEEFKQLRHDLAILVRSLSGIAASEDYDIPLLFSAVVDHAASTDPKPDEMYSVHQDMDNNDEQQWQIFARKLEPYMHLAIQIELMGVQRAAAEQPLLNGKEVVEYLSETKGARDLRPGKWLGGLLDRLLHWQFREGRHRIDRQRALSWIDTLWSDGTIGKLISQQ